MQPVNLKTYINRICIDTDNTQATQAGRVFISDVVVRHDGLSGFTWQARLR